MLESFFIRAEELLERVGEGELTGSVGVNQRYAVNQHEGGWRNFMGRYGTKEIRSHSDGQVPPSRFLSDPLNERGEEFLARFSDELLEGDLILEMAAVCEDLAGEVEVRAPERSGRLKRSASVLVTDGGVPVYERPAREGRR